MKAIPQRQEVLGAKATTEAESGTELPGVLPARDGLQPVTDFDAFLQSLPDFGLDAASLREAIAENRALRRAMAEGDEC
jgi:hypothetical protein